MFIDEMVGLLYNLKLFSSFLLTCDCNYNGIQFKKLNPTYVVEILEEKLLQYYQISFSNNCLKSRFVTLHN